MEQIQGRIPELPPAREGFGDGGRGFPTRNPSGIRFLGIKPGQGNVLGEIPSGKGKGLEAPVGIFSLLFLVHLIPGFGSGRERIPNPIFPSFPFSHHSHFLLIPRYPSFPFSHHSHIPIIPTYPIIPIIPTRPTSIPSSQIPFFFFFNLKSHSHFFHGNLSQHIPAWNNPQSNNSLHLYPYSPFSSLNP